MATPGKQLEERTVKRLVQFLHDGGSVRRAAVRFGLCSRTVMKYKQLHRKYVGVPTQRRDGAA
jgi:hypothetical protein